MKYFKFNLLLVILCLASCKSENSKTKQKDMNSEEVVAVTNSKR